MNVSRRTRIIVILLLAIGMVVGACQYQSSIDFLSPLNQVVSTPTLKPSRTPTRTRTPVVTATNTAVPATHTDTATTLPTDTPVPATPTDTATAGPTDTPAPTATPIPGATFTPWPAAPLCANHSYTEFHTLWNVEQGCHYDHEHGQNPFVTEVAAVFPGIQDFLGGVQVGHTNPSSPIENTDKHGGMKWNVQLVHPQTCAGFEGASTGVNGSAIQYHGFGDYAIEAEVRIHSTVAFLRQCKVANPTDYGYVYVVQQQDYGQRVVPYQGTIVGYPNQPDPAYPSPRGPYLSMDCIDLVLPTADHCRASFAQAEQGGVSSVWTSKVTGAGHSDTPVLFRLLWRVRDVYRLFDWNDQEHPFTFLWVCSTDGGAEYNPAGCRFNNSTTQVHEVAGVIPAAWDNLAGFDTDGRVGRVTGEGYTNGAGTLMATCLIPGLDCYPIKLVSAFTGEYGSVLVFTPGKGTNVVPFEPSRNIFFCDGAVCAEGDAGSVPSGWIGAEN